MLSYILLFSLIVIVILGIIRASKHNQPGVRAQKEPFMGEMQNEAVDEIEIVGKPRVVSRAPTPVLLEPEQKEQASFEDFADIPVAEGRQTMSPPVVDAPPLFAAKTETSEVEPVEDAPVNNVIVIHVIANPERPYHGYDLLQAMLTVGLRYGKWNIFHRHEEITGRGPILFSLASSVEPGTFDLAKMSSFSTPGLTLFMRTSAVANPRDAFEKLLAAAQQLVEELGGTACDAKRFPLSAEQIAKWREQIG